MILRCLEKKPAERFGTYQELAHQLGRFSSLAAPPASLPRRSLAGLIDVALFTVLAQLLFVALGVRPPSYLSGWSREALLYSAYGDLASFLYFLISEGIWGRTAGKARLGLRVAGPDGSRPGWRSVLIRASCFVFLYWPLRLAAYVLDGALSPSLLTIFSLEMALFTALFLTARRHNGFATIYDLLSRTRVVREPSAASRPAALTVPTRPATTEARLMVGPYFALHGWTEGLSEEVVAGVDPLLSRPVWIQRLEVGAPPVPPARRDLDRPGRPRWLSGRRTDREAWDVFEAPEGASLIDMAAARQPWSAVRHWLLDLAEELRAGIGDGTAPAALRLDRVWITCWGRVMLLDFPAPEARDSVAKVDDDLAIPSDETGARRFLHRVALCAIEGSVASTGNTRDRTPAGPLPLHARSFLKSLAVEPGRSLETFIHELKGLLSHEAVISRGRQVRYLGCLAAAPLILFLLVTLIGIAVAVRAGVAHGAISANDLEFILSLSSFPAVVVSLQSLVAIPSAFLLRGGIMLRLFGMAVVTRDGAEASRWRCLFRSLVSWSPAPAAATVLLPIAARSLVVEPPGMSIMKHPIGEAPVVGPATARVTIIDYLDYECERCEQVERTLLRLAAAYPDEVRVVYKVRPHADGRASILAEAAMAAHAQGKFREMHGSLLDADELSRGRILDLAAGLGLDAGRIEKELDSGAYRAAVTRHFREIEEAEISEGPALFINGHHLHGPVSYEKLEAEVLDKNGKTTRGYTLGTKFAFFMRRAGPGLWFALVAQVILLGGAIWSVLSPGRGIQDRLAGTFLVPR